MRRTLYAAFAVLVPISSAHSQTVDVQSLTLNGVEIRIGEDSATALAALRDSADVMQFGGHNSWEISQRRFGALVPTTLFGSVGITNGTVSSIFKTYGIGDGRDLSASFSEALRDAQRGVNEACHTSYTRANDGHVRMIRTTCGPNELDFVLSHVASAGGDGNATLIRVIVRAPAAKDK